jgi:hypothetical protein
MGAQRVGETVSRLTGTERIVPELRYALSGMPERPRSWPWRKKRAASAASPFPANRR